jgi:rhodanese-related sulfurtransferase
MYKTVTPKEAMELLENGYHYLDVRTEREFAEGHAEGAVNIPIAGEGMVPNPDFVEVVEATFPRDTKLVLGCKSGGRSARAAEVLEARGYAEVVNMDGGFHGRYSPFGSLEQKGWQDEGLPVSTETGEGVGYASLVEKAKGAESE